MPTRPRRILLIDDDIELCQLVQHDILELLVRSAGRVVSRDEISAVCHQRENSPFDRAIDVHVSHLRKKLDAGGTNLIRTIRGAGYLFAPE